MVEPSQQSLLVEAGEAYPGTVVEELGMQLLETLDALSTVYDSASYFAGVVGIETTAAYALEKCIEAVGCDFGVLHLRTDDGLEQAAEQGDAAARLRPGAVECLAVEQRTTFHNGAAALDLLTDAAGGGSVLFAPITVGERELGVVTLLCDSDKQFTTKDIKVVSTVMAQVGMAVSSALHLRDVEIERSKLLSVVENNREGIVVLDADGRTVLCNSAARELFGVAGEEVRGTDFFERISGWEFVVGDEILLRQPGTGEIARGSGAKRRVMSVCLSEIRNAEGELANVILTARELTEERREEKLKRDFLSLISHKFRTPLTGIIGGLTMLSDEDAEDRAHILGETYSRADELALMVDRLLCFAEIMEGSWSTQGRSNLGLLRESLHGQFMSRYPESGLDLIWEFGDRARLIRLPESRLRVILDNLIENAIRFSLPEAPWVRVRSRRSDDDSVVIEVEDRGPGIAVAERERVLRPFVQRDEDFTGTMKGVGIGLPLVAEIIRRVGGRVEIADAQPRGTLVTLVLPAVREQEQPTS